MAEYIEKQAAIDVVRAYLSDCCVEDGDYHASGIEYELNDLPSADVRPVVTCAECDWHVDCGYHFCNKWCQPCPDNADFYCAYGERPNCGAKMEGNE